VAVRVPDAFNSWNGSLTDQSDLGSREAVSTSTNLCPALLIDEPHKSLIDPRYTNLKEFLKRGLH
jgi:hypothetical protein